jgi:hypothetical protein
VVTVAFTALTWWITGSFVGLALSLLGVGLVFAVVAIAWQRLGRTVISLGQLFGIPLYVLGKLPMYLTALAGKTQSRWVRTERDKRRP